MALSWALALALATSHLLPSHGREAAAAEGPRLFLAGAPLHSTPALEVGFDLAAHALAAAAGEQQAAPATDASEEPRQRFALAGVNGTVDQGLQTNARQSWSQWWQDMQDSVVQFVIGIILLVFSLPVLWFNERRAARMESVIAHGRDQSQTVSVDEARGENCGRLVHVEGGLVKSAAEVLDRRFNVGIKENCIRLQSYVEIYQNIERQQTESDKPTDQRSSANRSSGGRENLIKYYYTPEWSSSWHDSSKFHPGSQVEVNKKPAGLDQPGYDVATCGRVEFGSGFMLDQELLSQLKDFKALTDLGDFVALRSTGERLCKSSDPLLSHWYYLRPTDPKWSGEDRNQIGDVRVKFAAVEDPEGPATVLALQGENDPRDASRGTFLPYRLVKGPWCGRTNPEAETYKRQLVEEGKKSCDQLAKDERCNLVCCCCCNLVAKCFAALLTPEIHHFFLGSLDKKATFDAIEQENKAKTGCLRSVGWLMMLAGLFLFFQPFVTFIQVIPFLGPILSWGLQVVVGVFSFIVALVLSFLIVVFAYAAYRPLTALLYMIAGAVVVAIPIFAIQMVGA